MSETEAERRALGERLAAVQRQVGEIGAVVYAELDWLQPNYTEPQVLYPLRDLLKPGQTGFDIGANFGFLSLAMSRRAGPRGAVCAFEANPEIARRCQALLVRNGCGNAQVISAAIYDRSHHLLPLYLSDNMVSDSVSRRVSERSIAVKTLALDDFVAETGLVPDLVKMDIEGAEYDALAGFRRTIGEHLPILILEQQPDDDRCFRLLRDLGYRALDLRSYEVLDDYAAIPADVAVTDVLYTRDSHVAGTPYAGPIVVENEAELGPAAFGWTAERRYETLRPIELRGGRYIVDVDFSAPTGAEMKCGVAMGGVPLMQHHGRADWLVHLARRWVVAVEASGPATLFFDFPRQHDLRLQVARAVVRRLPAFDGRAPLFA